MNFKRSSLIMTLPALLILLTVGPISACLAAEVQTEVGFKTLRDPATPDFLNQASKSVFQVLIPSALSVENIRVFDMNSSEFKDLQTRMQLKVGDKGIDQQKIVIERQIENCRREKKEKQCVLFLVFERSTAFIGGENGTVLLTNAHVIDRSLLLTAQATGKPIAELLKNPQWLPLFLFNQSGELVFDSLATKPSLIQTAVPSLHAKLKGQNWYGDDSDYVLIQLPHSLGIPLRMTKQIEFGERLYLAGYPVCTGCGLNLNRLEPALNQNRGRDKNSDGDQLFWTSGVRHDLNSAVRFLKASMDYFIHNTHTANWIFLSADAQVGMSGGPIFNRHGEVVGIFAGAKSVVQQDGTLTVLSRGVRLPELDFGLTTAVRGL